jgi:hypothetical protein
MDVADLSDSPVTGGTSAARTITETQGWFSFTGLSAVLASGTTYAIMVTRTDHGSNETDFSRVNMSTSLTALSGDSARYYSDGTLGYSYTYDCGIKIYILQ